MSQKILSSFTLFFLLWFAPGASANCGLSIIASDLNVEWDLNWTSLGISVQVSKTDPAQCTFGLGASQGGAGSYTRQASNGGLALHYQLYQDSNKSKILKSAPDITSANDAIMVTMPAGGNPQVEMYYFDIPFAAATSPLVAAGVYTDSFIINAYEGSDPALFADPPATSATVNVNITVPKMIRLALVDTGGVFQDTATTKSIEFGNLNPGKVSRFDMRIRTNAGYQVNVSSANNGNMKHITGTTLVPYTMTVNGVTADTTGAVPVLNSTGQTSLVGLGYPVRITIGTLPTMPLAGEYRDTVTITAITTE